MGTNEIYVPAVLGMLEALEGVPGRIDRLELDLGRKVWLLEYDTPTHAAEAAEAAQAHLEATGWEA